jgi:hypothetical protein
MNTSTWTLKLSRFYDTLWLTIVDTPRAYRGYWSSVCDSPNLSVPLVRFWLYCLICITAACHPDSKTNQQSANKPSIEKQGTNRPIPTASKESTQKAPSIPQSGTPGERVRKLWAESKLVIKADAEANLSEAEYQARRAPLFRAWLDLQSVLSQLGRPDGIMGERAASEVLVLISRVYGYPGYTETERQQRRRNTNVTKELLELDQRIKTLP